MLCKGRRTAIEREPTDPTSIPQERAEVYDPDDLHLAVVNHGHSYSVIRYTPEFDDEFGCPTFREISSHGTADLTRAYLKGLEYGERVGYNCAAQAPLPGVQHSHLPPAK